MMGKTYKKQKTRFDDDYQYWRPDYTSDNQKLKNKWKEDRRKQNRKNNKISDKSSGEEDSDNADSF